MDEYVNMMKELQFNLLTNISSKCSLCSLQCNFLLVTLYRLPLSCTSLLYYSLVQLFIGFIAAHHALKGSCLTIKNPNSPIYSNTEYSYTEYSNTEYSYTEYEESNLFLLQILNGLEGLGYRVVTSSSIVTGFEKHDTKWVLTNSRTNSPMFWFEI